MLLSRHALVAQAAIISIFFINLHQVVSQNLVSGSTQETYSPDVTKNDLPKTFSKFISIHISPSKAVAGELPVMVGLRLSRSWMIEVGAGPTFRDRIAEKIFDGNTFQKLGFANKKANYNLGYAFYSGARYLIDKEVLQGFYLNPEFAYLHRNVSYPSHQADYYKGSENDMNVRMLLGYDRACCDISEHLYYGGFFGFGMRRYEANYFTNDNSDPGTRHSVDVIPTFHLGYRLGYKF